jgi:hypothetical protein
VRRQKERRAADELSMLKISVGGDDDEASPKVEEVVPPSPILNVSFLDWVSTYSGPSFNLIHCDFPYGINADKFNQGSAEAYGGYEDTPELYWSLVAALIDNREKLLGTADTSSSGSLCVTIPRPWQRSASIFGWTLTLSFGTRVTIRELSPTQSEGLAAFTRSPSSALTEIERSFSLSLTLSRADPSSEST